MNSKYHSTKMARQTAAQPNSVLSALEGYRRMWEEAAEGQSLLELTAPVGLVIADVATSLGLDRQERLSVLGRDLNSAVSAYLEQPIRLKQ